MIRLTLTGDDIELAHQIANDRQRTKHDVTNRKIDRTRDDLATHLMGARGEVATARWLGGRVDTVSRKYGDRHGGDIILPDTRIVEAKTRAKIGWDFALTSGNIKEFRADLGVLCYDACERHDEILIVGWVTREEFIDDHRLVNYGYGNRCVLEHALFHPAEEWDMAWNALTS